jgi:hypothetical protein
MVTWNKPTDRWEVVDFVASLDRNQPIRRFSADDLTRLHGGLFPEPQRARAHHGCQDESSRFCSEATNPNTRYTCAPASSNTERQQCAPNTCHAATRTGPKVINSRTCRGFVERKLSRSPHPQRPRIREAVHRQGSTVQNAATPSGEPQPSA